MKRDIRKKVVGLVVSVILIALIFSVLIPPATAVLVSPGSPSPTSVTTGSTVTFSNVNLTIKGAEKIPVNNLTFTVYNSGNSQVGYVKFYINGAEITDSPSGKFTVTNTTVINSNWYGYAYDTYGYDEISGWNGTTPYTGYGYGYNDSSLGDITFLYTIVYTTHTTGTFHAQLSVNSTIHTYTSSSSSPFTVSSGGGGGGTPPSGDDDDDNDDTGEEEEEGTQASDDTVNDVEEQFNVTLDEPFYGNDTDGDGVIDSFTDPNGVLTIVHDDSVSINASTSFLISTDGDEIPEFFWDTESDTITPITHAPATVTDTYIDEEEDTVTVVIEVDKSDWIYIEVADDYPDIPNIVVKTSDGRIISSDLIWRENGKIYVLDDPDIQYVLIYTYTMFEPTFDPESGTTFDTSTPTITITYQEYVEITAASFDSVDILDQITSSDNKVFIFTLATGLSDGTYTLSITAEDLDGNTLISTASYTIFAGEPETKAFPLLVLAAIAIVLAIILLVVFLFKTGYLYVEKTDVEEEKPPVKKKSKDAKK